MAGARFRFPAQSLLPGATPDQELKFATVGNRFMSGPLSAWIVTADWARMPWRYDAPCTISRLGADVGNQRSSSARLRCRFYSVNDTTIVGRCLRSWAKFEPTDYYRDVPLGVDGLKSDGLERLHPARSLNER
jgi:hypothetical protein